MKEAKRPEYIIKVFEAQWDSLHEISIKPFFQILKNECEVDGHNPLYSYHVFQNGESLKDSMNYLRKDPEITGKSKIMYLAAHGLKDRIQAAKEISRTRLKNLLLDSPHFNGAYFGACDFVNKKTADVLLNKIPTLEWIAGYSQWVPWVEGTICDLMFFKILLGGEFSRKTTRGRWGSQPSPFEAAEILFKNFPLAKDLKFNLFAIDHSTIKSAS